jgi:hypothetical protein
MRLILSHPPRTLDWQEYSPAVSEPISGNRATPTLMSKILYLGKIYVIPTLV